MTYTTQTQVRAAFWRTHHECARLRRPGPQNAQLVGVRTAWCEYVDMLARDGQISESLAQKVTL